MSHLPEQLRVVYAIKTEVQDAKAATWVFDRQKTMYNGKRISVGDVIFVFASENEGGLGLVARGVVTLAVPIPLTKGVERQTPRVSITVKRQAEAIRPLGREELREFKRWNDGRPETELNFKFYRQATNKIVGLSQETEAFLQTFF